MANNLFQNVYNPDVLSCIANLSSDEVFTPPELANKMLDMLPQELFCNPDTTFLDPCCKSGVFLREIAKRLLVGLEPQIPDLGKRIEHIFTKQVFGIAITELTSLLSRRSVYCSKYPSSRFSAYQFAESKPQGNIIFQRIRHTWDGNKCKYCGASKTEYDRDEALEQYAYQFIHNLDVNKVFNMKFDVIIGNPPYQLSDGGAQASAIPIYHLFIQTAKKLRPRYLTMIIPSRWFAGGRGVDSFRDEMLHDRHITNLVDFPISSDCFPGVEIKGGVCYFLWERDTERDCKITTIQGNIEDSTTRPLLEKGGSTFIRWNKAISILRKVQKFKEPTFDSLVSAQKPFGLRTYVTGEYNKKTGYITLFRNGGVGYINQNEITQHKEWVNQYKVFISRAYGAGDEYPHQILNSPLFGEIETACTETYVVIGPFNSKENAFNVQNYIKTRFFRFLVLLIKNTQDAPKRVYSFVPMQDFSKTWTDEELYAKYNLSAEEIDFIETMISPIE